MVDWGALLGLMSAAAHQERDPFTEAVHVQERLFTSKPIFLGVEESLKHPHVPCGLKTDAERARHVRKRVREILNSRGDWQLMPSYTEKPLREILLMEPIPGLPLQSRTARTPQNESEPREVEKDPINIVPLGLQPAMRSVLTEPDALEKVGHGILAVVGEQDGRKIYGRSLTVAEVLNDGKILLVKWIRRLVNWHGRQVPMQLWEERLVPQLEKKLAEQRTPVIRLETQAHKIVAMVSLADLTMRVPVDSYEVPLWRPYEREVLPSDCARCALVPVCRQLPTATGVAMLWRRLGLVDTVGVPTLRGRVVSFFSGGDGLAIAAALEDTTYHLDELIYDLANLDAGFRFAGDENRWGGRLPMACHQVYGLQTIPGYLENGVPPKYGAGAEQVVAAIHKDPLSKGSWITDLLGAGDIDRVIIEWRSLLRQIANAPTLEWPRWHALQAMAKGILLETESPTLTDLPPLDYAQTRRIDHQLILRRH
jgi:hypothetical protein